MSSRQPALIAAGVVCALALQSACTTPDPAPVTPTPASEAPAADVAPADRTGLGIDEAPSDEVLVAGLTGQEITEQICGECHSMDPPPLKAPPLTHLARHLRETFDAVDGAVAHVLEYAPGPNAEHSILPERAVERFGLMPPQPLPAPMLEAATRYIWSLASSEDVQRPIRMRRGRGGGEAEDPMGMMRMRGGDAASADGQRRQGERGRCRVDDANR
ncbi:MAG: hypothetical protein KJP18_13690 [Gemmatimonadetes bacterium]|nr:hypothetical protein [Gemmatimonadota bacterium]NNF37343.1 hypothetical protein [Gemmatimonadota bacterium]NNK65059.1 hypothetical protein [Gemmatimonadota bacterium]